LKLFNILVQRGIVSGKDIELLKIILSANNLVLDHKNKIRVSKGVPQGFSCSPLFFIVYLDHVMKLCDLKVFFKAYADDIILCAYDLELLKSAFKKINFIAN
jgi:hypothetical protein